MLPFVQLTTFPILYRPQSFPAVFTIAATAPQARRTHSTAVNDHFNIILQSRPMLGRDSSVGIVTWLRSGQFDARLGEALRSSQHVVPGYHPEAVMRPGHEADHSPACCDEPKTKRRHTPTPICQLCLYPGQCPPKGSLSLKRRDNLHVFSISTRAARSAVAKVLCYKSEGRRFDPRW